MPVEGRLQAVLLATLIVLLGIVGLGVIVGLTWAFRRMSRGRRARRKRDERYVDMWQESGRRARPVDTSQDHVDEDDA